MATFEPAEQFSPSMEGFESAEQTLGIPAKRSWMAEGRAALGALGEFDFKKGLLGRAATGAGQALREWSRGDSSMAEQQAGGAQFRQAPVKEKAPGFGEAVGQLYQAAKDQPGATLGSMVAAVGEDFWMFLIPEFGASAKIADVAAKVLARGGKIAEGAGYRTGMAAGKGAKFGSVGGAAEIAAQAGEEGQMQPQGVATSAAMWGAMGAAGGLIHGKPQAPKPPGLAGFEPAAETVAKPYAAKVKDVKAAVKAIKAAVKVRKAALPPEGGEAVWSINGTEVPVKATGPAVKGPDGLMYTPVEYGGNAGMVPSSQLSPAPKAASRGPSAPAAAPEPMQFDVSGKPNKHPFESKAGEVPKTRLPGDGKLLAEAGKAEPAITSALDKMRAGQGFLVTAEERVALRSAAQAQGRVVNAEGKVFNSILGKADPRLLAGIAAAGGLAAYIAANPDAKEALAGAGLLAGAALTTRLKGMPEVSLLELVRKGGPEGKVAATQLYTDNLSKLTRNLRQYERNVKGFDAGETAHELLAITLSDPAQLAKFQNKAALRTYLTTAGRRQAVDDYRRSIYVKTEPLDATELPGKGRDDVSTAGKHEQIADTSLQGRSPEQNALNAEMGQRMEKAFERLPEQQRKVFEMAELEELPYEAIAQELGMPIGTVRSTLARARESMRGYMKEYATPQAKPGQEGRVDSDLLEGVAAAGVGAAIGAYLGPDTPIQSGIYGILAGAALGTGKGRALLKQAIKSPDTILGAVSTRLGNMAPELKQRFRVNELEILQKLDRANDQIYPFLQAVKRLPKETYTEVARALLNGDHVKALQTPELRAAYAGVRQVLGDLEAQLQSLGRFGEGVSNYFPRLVKDFEGLKNALGQEAKLGLEKALIEAEAKMMRKSGRSLTDVEQSIVTNRYLFAEDKGSYQPGFAKDRVIKEVTPELQQFYEPPTESLLRYITGATTDIQTAKFFGKDLTTTKAGKKLYTDVDGSIGNLTARLMREGKLTQTQAMELRNILKARFEGGDRGMTPALAVVRNLTNAGLLGNVASAATQLGDSALTIYHHGMVPTVQALAEKVIGKERVTPKQLGLINHVAEELSELGVTGQVLHTAMKYSGFHAIDMFAKGLGINAALIKAGKAAKTPAGQKALTAEYGELFGREMPKVLDDLANRRVTPETEMIAFDRLSDTQPVSRAEMPEAYLAHPNGRILYQLKTYMIKQGDVVRRDVYQKMASGNPRLIAEGAKNLMALSAIYAVANIPGQAVKNWMYGRDEELFTTPNMVENVLQTFGLNRYTRADVGKGKVVEAVTNTIMPPVKVLQDVALMKPKAISYVPIGGRVVYNRMLGGNEKYEVAKTKAENIEAKAEGRQTKKLSPAAKEYLRQKRLEAKRKKIAERNAR